MRLGTFLILGSPEICEILDSRLDFAVIDTEHSVILDSRIRNLLQSLPQGITSWIRIKQPEQAGLAFDLGAKAVLVPQIRSIGDVKLAVDSSFYPPLGKRGWGPGRASKYGMRMMEILDEGKSNELWIQIETVESLQILEEIGKIEGVTGLFVGPGDLSLALGIPGEWNSRSLGSAIERVMAVCKNNGKKFGIFTADPEQVIAWKSRGADLVILGSDSTFFMDGLRNALDSAGSKPSDR